MISESTEKIIPLIQQFFQNNLSNVLTFLGLAQKVKKRLIVTSICLLRMTTAIVFLCLQSAV